MPRRRAGRKAIDRSLLMDMSADERSEFIAPEVQWFALDLANNRVEVVEGEYDERANWADDTVSAALVPFLTSLSFDTLHKALAQTPYLYWHPIVRAQILYLARLLSDERLWEELRWGSTPFKTRPEGVRRAVELLQALIAAHADFLVRGYAVHWKSKKRPGPHPGITNPHPADQEFDARIGPLTLMREFASLRDTIKVQKEILGLSVALGGSISAASRKKLARACYNALTTSDITWSSLYRQRVRRWKIPGLRHAVDALLDEPKRRFLRKAGLPTRHIVTRLRTGKGQLSPLRAARAEALLQLIIETVTYAKSAGYPTAISLADLCEQALRRDQSFLRSAVQRAADDLANVGAIRLAPSGGEIFIHLLLPLPPSPPQIPERPPPWPGGQRA